MAVRRIVNKGDVFGRLKILKETTPQTYFRNTGQQYHKRVFTVECSCDKHTIFDVQLNHLVTGKILGCGCVRLERIDKTGLELRTVHGMMGTPTYQSYCSMLSRCNHPEKYKDYGDVDVCARWQESFENFFEDMGARPEGCTINRIFGSKVYSKETCEWASLNVQSYDQKQKCTNTSGRTGVSLVEGRWRACIGYLNKNLYLGMFDNKEDAIIARQKAEKELYGFNKD